MNCPTCPQYNNGRGVKACLKCPQYIEIIKQSFSRLKIKIETVPDIILEAIPDDKEKTAYDRIRDLPTELSAPLLLRYYLDCSNREVANLLHCSRSRVQSKINIALEFIKENTQNPENL